jgi:hypothetical protein
MLHSFFYDDTATKPATLSSRTAAGQRAYGQAMVKMAIVIGVLLLVILGGLDVQQIQMTHYTVSRPCAPPPTRRR